uniref:Ig-like domain-containing protein n=1 Tax=Cyprinodon variegatus TaxID=28743 RepID=A0A3Q2FY43_CYPVA
SIRVSKISDALVCPFKGKMVRTYLDVQGPSPSLQFKAVNIGLNITLKCLYKESDGVIFYWYKQTLGQKPKLISEFYKYKRNSSLKGEFWKDQRFDLETGTDKNNLKILNVQMSDSATYYCTGIHSYEYKFLEGIILHVMESDLSVWTPQLGFEDIQSEGSVSLGCRIQTGSCNEGYSVYWVQSSEEHLPRIIYTQDTTDELCKRDKTTQTNSCVYSYTIERMNESHAGTYHCAVALCGHILFGKGITLDHKKKFNTSVMVYVLSGTLAFVTMLAFFLAIILYKKSCKGKIWRANKNRKCNRTML